MHIIYLLFISDKEINPQNGERETIKCLKKQRQKEEYCNNKDQEQM